VRRLGPAAAVLVLMAACGGSADSTSSEAPPSTEAAETTTAPETTAAPTTTLAPTTTTTPPEGFVVTSDDGNVTIEVPPEALTADPGIAVGVLAPEDYPEALAGAEQNPGTVVYSLEPDGTELGAPVEISRTIPASNFAGLPPTGIPLVTLLVTTPDGGFDQLAGATVIREGENVIVRGQADHFSALVTIYEQQYAVVGSTHLEFATEVGTPLSAGIGFYTADGVHLEPPTKVTPSGWTRDSVEFGVSDSYLDVDCTEEGEYRVGLRWDVELPIGEGAGSSSFGLRSTPQLAGDGTLPNLRLKFAGPLRCLDPDTAITGRAVTIDSRTDHPGGEVYVPGEDFGGASGVDTKIWIDIGGHRLMFGLIEDTNGNGMVDGTDTMFAPKVVDQVEDGYRDVLPVNRYADYFFYLGRADDYPGIEKREIQTQLQLSDVESGVFALGGLFRGEGRFETSVGIPYLGDIPLLHRVFASEGGEGARDTDLVILIAPQIITAPE
jgi:hypothetical protein